MLSRTDFEFIARILKHEAGISLESGKEYLVESRVEPVAKSLGFGSVAELVSNLRQADTGAKRRQLVESLTTHESSFFRDNEPFEILKQRVLPELIERNRSKRELTIWCGAASSGQEPYSLCMLLQEEFPELGGWKIRFMATDVSQPILERARAGIYSQLDVSRGLPANLLAKYFDHDGPNWIIKPRIRSMVEFSEQNLLHAFGRIPVCDLVMLRNVLIYFDVDTKKDILRRVYELVRPGGYLFLGTAETTFNLYEAFERVTFDRTSCYRRNS